MNLETNNRKETFGDNKGGSCLNQQNRVSDVNAVFLFTILTFELVGFLATFLFHRYGIVLTASQSILISQFSLIIPALVYVIKNKINLLEFIRFKRLKFGTIFLLIPFGICIMPLMSCISYLSMLVFQNHIGQTVDSLVTNSSFLLSFLVVAVVPAIFEEAVYRGVFFNEYRKVNIRKGILLSGLLFGLLHMNMNQFFYAFAMGVIFALLIEATDSILASMIVHLVMNGYSVTMTKVGMLLSEQRGITDTVEQLQGREGIVTVLGQLFVPTVIATLVAGVLFLVITMANGRTDHVKEIVKPMNTSNRGNVTYVTPCFIIGIAICVIEMIAKG